MVENCRGALGGSMDCIGVGGLEHPSTPSSAAAPQAAVETKSTSGKMENLKYPGGLGGRAAGTRHPKILDPCDADRVAHAVSKLAAAARVLLLVVLLPTRWRRSARHVSSSTTHSACHQARTSSIDIYFNYCTVLTLH